MVQVSSNLDAFTTSDWERSFGAFVKANRSHWTGPPYDMVVRMLKEKGAYEFGVPGLGTWTCRFRLSVENDGSVHATFVKNPALGPRMIEKLQTMEHTFLKELGI